MDLRSDTPYWLIRNGYLSDYPPLRRDLATDVLIVGGGITGALIGHRLAMNGVDVAIVDRRHIGFGSTSASTCFLQYEIDVPLFELSEKIGVKDASREHPIALRWPKASRTKSTAALSSASLVAAASVSTNATASNRTEGEPAS